VVQGVDPAADIRDARRAVTISELIDLYLAEGCAHKKQSTLVADRARFAHYIRPILGTKAVTDISRADIERLMADVIAGRFVRPARGTDTKRLGPRSVPRGGRGVASQVVTLCGTLLAFAVKRGLRTDNPAHGIEKPKVRKLERFLTTEEISRLGAALICEENTTGNPYPAAAILLLLLTGARKSEILGLRWTWVDFERSSLFLPDSKTGRKTIHLSAPAVDVLKSLPRLSDNPFVFRGARPGQAFLGIDRVWSRVRLAAGLEDVRLHDLRDSAASIAAAAGASLLLIGRVLGHKQASTTERYAHLTADPIKATSELIGTHVAAALDPSGKKVDTSGEKRPVGGSGLLQIDGYDVYLDRPAEFNELGQVATSGEKRPVSGSRLLQIGSEVDVYPDRLAEFEELWQALRGCGLADHWQLSECTRRIVSLPTTLLLPSLHRPGLSGRPPPELLKEMLGDPQELQELSATLLAAEEGERPKEYRNLSRAEQSRAKRRLRALIESHPTDISGRKGRPAEFDGALALYLLFVIAEATGRSVSDFTYTTNDEGRRPGSLLRALMAALCLHLAKPRAPSVNAVVTRIIRPARSTVFLAEAQRFQLTLAATGVAAAPDMFRFLLRDAMRQDRRRID
jgi:integrase